MKRVQAFTLKNELGLHARVAATLVNTAKRFKARITYERDGIIVDGKSILGILTLACPKGGRIIIVADGPDSAEAMKAFETLIEDKFGEE
ncbi:MAG: HPr family phosphocarrier protein [Syntrophales bacterium]|jgi:phosphocarrier protein|nr:HPr family phosphocarrier protein [Syntrophales bacterium]MCK9527729.1 HPr family phosphocarrier protein [Syntrophales bacterium]MDX9921616.1 HPr family phosphocarrier protein [Syntrophales bacterium]